MNTYIYACPPSSKEACERIKFDVVAKEGSIDGSCSVCNEPVVVGPNTQESMKRLKGDLVCFECIIKSGQVGPDNVKALGATGHKYIPKE